MVAMEEEAELALLDQHLQQTNILASRMTAILGRLDTRLSRLDKTVAPFGIQPLTKEARNIDAALAVLSGEKITEIKGYDVVSSRGEEGIISRMPEYSTLDEYTRAIDRVLRDIDRLSRSELRSAEANIKDLSKLVELGAKNLVTLFLKFVRDGSSQVADLEHIARDGPPQPPNLLPTLPLVIRIHNSLIALPALTTHTPTLSLLHATISTTRNGYASIRRDWVTTRCLHPLLREFDELVEGPMSPGREEEGRKVKCRVLGSLLQGLIALMQGEQALWTQIFSKPSASGLSSIFTSPVSLISDLLASQVTSIRKSLSNNTFYAFELYSTLLALQPRWESAVRELTGDAKLVNVIAEQAAVLRGVCLRSFPEILVDVKSPMVASRRSAGDLQTVGVADVTYSTVAYLETLPHYEAIVTALLNSLGDRNWLMGASAPTKPLGTSRNSSGDEDGIVQHFVTDLVAALCTQLDFRARSMKRPISSIFMLNNLSYIRNNLILSSSSNASDILGVAGEGELNRAFRDAKQKYLESWQALAELLSDSATSGSSSRFGSVVGGGDRQASKEGLTNFFSRFEEMENISRHNQLSKQDPNLRDRLRQDVKNIVMNALNSFQSKHTKLERYMRMTPEEVENRLTALFR